MSLSKACISLDNVAFILKKTTTHTRTHMRTHYACLACKFIMFVQIGGRCVRAAERGVCHVVIFCGNCLISLTSASNPHTPTKQSNNYYMARTQTQTRTWIQT